MSRFDGKALARRLLAASALALGVMVAGLAAQPAEARVFVGVGLGLGVGPYCCGYGYYNPYYYAPGYYAPGYYAPYYYPPAAVAPPVVYQQAPTVYQQAPQPQYYQQQQAAPPPAGADGKNCRPYQGSITVDGAQQTTTGTACQSPDGTWHAVN